MKPNCLAWAFLLFLIGCASTPEQQVANEERQRAQRQAELDRRQAEENRKLQEEQKRIVQKYASYTTDQLRVKVHFLTQELSLGYFGQGIGLLIAKGQYDGKVKDREEIAMEVLRREGKSPSERDRLRDSDRPVVANEESIVSSGTGFFITEDGYLITNEHVVRKAAQVLLVTNEGPLPAKIIKVDAANDLALLKAEGKFNPLPVTFSRSVRLGNTVVTVGFPNIGLQGFAPKFARGEIAALSGAADDARYFQISVPVQPGNSGGALLDERGNVIGVVAAKLNVLAALQTSGALPENVNYAVKSSLLLSFLESVPEVSSKLREPSPQEIKTEEVTKSAENAAVLVLVY